MKLNHIEIQFLDKMFKKNHKSYIPILLLFHKFRYVSIIHCLIIKGSIVICLNPWKKNF